MRLAGSAAAALLVVLVGARIAWSEDAPPPATASIDDLVARVVAPDRGQQDQAIDALLRKKSEDVVPALRKALDAQPGFQERISLAYLLAVHGEKAGLEVLVDSLEQTGHLGYVYLTRVAPEDFGWNRDGSSLQHWRGWLAKFSEEEYREQHRRERLPRDVRTSGDDAFLAAAKALRDGAERGKVAAQFRAMAAKFHDADAAPRALEVATELEVAAKEDAAWKEPASPPAPSAPERVAWLVHHLRDLRGFERRSMGYCTVLPPRRKGEPSVETAATAFVAMGDAAVPTLLGLLEDRRPIRAFAWANHRGGDREWAYYAVVLRVQDAALEILNTLLPTPAHERRYTSTYLSDEDPPDRAETIADVRSWAAETVGKTADERAWAGVRRARVEDALATLRRLASEGKKDAVLGELRRMYDGGRSSVHRPAICEVMAELGDTSKVAEVVAALEAGEYTSSMITEDGDRSVGLRAQAAAERVKAKYGAADAATAEGTK